MLQLQPPTLEELVTAMERKLVLVTGAASGIGYATAELFAKSGAQVIIVDRDEGLGSKAAETIGHGAVFIKCDVTSWEDQERLFAEAYLIYGKIDVVVCNAGIDPEIILAGDPEAEKVLDEDTGMGLKCPPNMIMDVNFNGAMYGIKLSVHYMKKNKIAGGRIVIMGSAASYIPVPTQPIYCASKHAVLGLVRGVSQRSDCIENQISISMVAPWFTVTPMTSRIDQNVTRHAPASSSYDVALAVADLVVKPLQHVNGKCIWVQGQTYVEVEEVIRTCVSGLILKVT
ncbi:hypothetical protein B0O99DRAFT_522882 [Bisporella sp. PMI_857]|nr:hypothetical protein B0O99DRAFT_522882 [Bisporella sp. PMI_857]